jgi:hypothetical protein
MAYTDYISGRIYSEEQDRSFFISGLGQTVTAMVGTACWGPMATPTPVYNEDDWKAKFGPPVADSNSYQCARANFQRNNNMLFVRAGTSSALAAYAQATTGGGGTPPTFTAKYPGTYGNSLRIDFVQGTLGASYCKATIYNNTTSELLEIFDNLPIACAGDFATPMASSGWIVVTNGSGAGNINVPQTVTLILGHDGINAIADTDYIGSSGATKTGLQTLRSQAQDIDLILCPNHIDDTTPQALQATVYTAMVSVAEARQDCIAILDPAKNLIALPDVGGGPYSVDTYWRGTGGHTQKYNANTSFAATYWSWITVTDYYNSLADLSLPPGPACAGAISYSDSVAYPWWAPAGVNRGMLSPLVKGTAYQPLDTELITLMSDSTMGGINPILLLGSSYYVMGQKTLLRTNSALNRINTRRMVNKIRKQMTAKLSILQYEPNDEYTWRQFAELIKPTLDYFVATRGLLAYDIQVGLNVSMTADDVGAGRLIGQVILVLMATGEKVIFQYVITDQDANFSELTGS